MYCPCAARRRDDSTVLVLQDHNRGTCTDLSKQNQLNFRDSQDRQTDRWAAVLHQQCRTPLDPAGQPVFDQKGEAQLLHGCRFVAPAIGTWAVILSELIPLQASNRRGRCRKLPSPTLPAGHGRYQPTNSYGRPLLQTEDGVQGSGPSPHARSVRVCVCLCRRAGAGVRPQHHLSSHLQVVTGLHSWQGCGQSRMGC